MSPTGKPFRFVRACVRARSWWNSLSRDVADLFLFPCCVAKLSLPLPPPQTSFLALVELIGMGSIFLKKHDLAILATQLAGIG